MQKRRDVAIVEYTAAKDTDPTAARPNISLMNCYSELHNSEKALMYADAALQCFHDAGVPDTTQRLIYTMAQRYRLLVSSGRLMEAVAVEERMPIEFKKLSASEMQEFKAELIELLKTKKIKGASRSLHEGD